MVRAVHLGGDAFRDGLSEGDLILSVDGKSAVDMDLNTHVNALRKGATVRMQIFNNGGIQDIEIKYKGSSRPKTYRLGLDKKNRKNALRKAWLAPVYEE